MPRGQPTNQTCVASRWETCNSCGSWQQKQRTQNRASRNRAKPSGGVWRPKIPVSVKKESSSVSTHAPSTMSGLHASPMLYTMAPASATAHTVVESQKDIPPFWANYCLDDLRRLAEKLVDLAILTPAQIEAYVHNDSARTAARHERVLCMNDSRIQWTTYSVKNTDFTFPHFMQDPVYLARGGFGTVVKCFRYGEPVAVKKVDVPDAYDSEMALRLLRELVVMKQAKKLHQPHICKIIDIFGDPSVKRPQDLNHIFIIMPLYKPGALDSVAVDTPAMFKTISGHTLSALHFLHQHKLMHRDIKKENIFYDSRKKRAFLADLGQARTLRVDEMTGNGEVGTRPYLSPEILQGHSYDFHSDVYSLGQTWYEILCLSGYECLFPYKKSGGKDHIRMQSALDPENRDKRRLKAKAGMELTPGSIEEWANEKWVALERKSKEWSEEVLITILERMLRFAPSKRADTTKLFEMPYFIPFVTENKVMDLGEVETHDYTEIKQRIFDLQHGSCQPNEPRSPEGRQRQSMYEKMCSKAVQYFARNGDESEVD